MNRDDIIRMAREANLTDGIELPHEIEAVERFAALVAATEREAIENLIEKIKNDWEKDGDIMKVYASEYLLTAIRARGQE